MNKPMFGDKPGQLSGAGGNQPGLNELMKKAKEMQQKMQEIQTQIANMRVIGQAGGRSSTNGAFLVEITMTGQHFAERIKLDPSIVKAEDKKTLEDLIAAAINDAANKIEKGTREKMTALTGIKLPDGFDG